MLRSEGLAADGDALHVLHVAAQGLADLLAPGMVAGHARLAADCDALHVFHITTQYLTDLLALGMVAGHT